MRSYLVVIDSSTEAELALRFAARRARQTGARIIALTIIPSADFVAFGNIQATIEAEAREEAEQLLNRAAATVRTDLGSEPVVLVRSGKPAEVVRELIQEQSVSTLVLGAAASGAPGPLVDHFTGPGCGTLPCAVMIVPGSLKLDQIDALS